MGEQTPALHADEPPSRDSAHLDALAADWARLGVLFAVEPSPAPVDVERLIVDTAGAAPDDERLFVCAASWLAEHHGFVNGERLAAVAGDLDALTSAVLGALLSVAAGGARRLPELEAARARCRPLAEQKPLFSATDSMRVLRDRARGNALPVFTAWGLLHDDDRLKPSAIRPVAWLLTSVPELRARYRSDHLTQPGED